MINIAKQTTAILRELEESKRKKRKKLGVLIDPDQLKLKNLDHIIEISGENSPDYFLIGGSLILNDRLEECLQRIRRNTNTPVILFPGSPLQIHTGADAILFLSLISGRNPDYLIGHHVLAAPYLRNTSLEILSVGYILINGGTTTTAQYISNTQPIPATKDDIAVCTALAGEMLGLRLIYLDTGSGASQSVPVSMITAVTREISVPCIVGGGIRTPEALANALSAGAEMAVVGTAVEKDPRVLREMLAVVKTFR